MKKIILFSAAILLIGGAIFYFIVHRDQKKQPSENVSGNVKTIDNSQSHVNPPGGETNIPIKDGKFQPDQMTVATGTQVNWINQDSVKHTVVSDNNDFRSDDINNNQYFPYTFTEPGEYHYHDGTNPDVKGVLIVKDIPQ